MFFIALNCYINFIIFLKIFLSAQCIMMKNQSIKLPLKSITKHAQRFNKGLRAKNKLEKNFNRKAKAEIYGYYMCFLQKK